MEAPIYLFTGPEFGKRNDAVDAVKKAFIKKVGEIDEHSFYLCETPFSQVMTILQSGTLFSNGVFVVHTRKSEPSGVYFADSLPGCCSGYKTV